MDKSGKCEPVIAASLISKLGSGKIIPNEEYTTVKTGINSTSPVWNEKFNFGKFFDLAVDIQYLPILNINLYHVKSSSSKQPMGWFQIPLESISDGLEAWYDLKKMSVMLNVSGEIHLRFKWTEPLKSSFGSSFGLSGGGATTTAAGGGALLAGSAGGSNIIIDGQPTVDPEFADQPPNELRIVCIQGRNLLAMDTGILQSGLSDPFVKVKVTGCEKKKTKYIPKTLNPVWNETLVFENVTDPSKSVEVFVEDYDLTGTDFMGKVLLPLREYKDKKPVRKWFKLGSKTGDMDATKRGEVELQIWWTFNVKLLAVPKKKASILSRMASGVVMMASHEDSDPEDDDSPDPTMKDNAPKKTAKEIEAEEAEKKKTEEETKKAAGEVDIKDGDYQVQVHIIECRDLKPENLDGTSDPVVYVECFDQKLNTKVIYQKLNCVFDDVLIFNFKNMTKEAFQDGIIRISVYDANSVPMMKNTLIGIFKNMIFPLFFFIY
jgi:Ca2+-dependent lipid-binding protein